MLAAFHKEAKEGGWKILQEEIRPKEVFLVVKVWPNHSAELVVRRFQRAGTRMKRHNPDSFPGKVLWGRGYMASTSVELMTEMSEHIAVQKQV
jgi:REP element-mobilizing transposase RayT